MTNKLRFSFSSDSNCFPSSKIDKNKHVYHLSVILFVDNSHFEIFAVNCEVPQLESWIIENSSFIKNEDLIISDTCQIQSGESFAQCLYRLLERDFSEDEEDEEFQWHNEIFSFRQRHSLRSALRGVDIPDVFIGTNHGKGEISLFNSNESWSHTFDLEDFLEEVRSSIK